MKISSMELTCDRDGLQKFKKIDLGKVVILSGPNGSGKTRMLKLIREHIKSLQNNDSAKAADNDLKLEISDLNNDDISQPLTSANVKQIELLNYSHYDASLQFPKDFTPYVISKAKDILKKCNYEETALNSLLLLEDMANGYSKEFQSTQIFDNIAAKLKELSGIRIEPDNNTKHLKICELEPEKSFLSPGQQYLLRIAIACEYNIPNERMIIMLDEPELHLHPKALIEVIELLKKHFPESQLWVATHSLALISYFVSTEKSTTVLNMENGKVSLPRSNSTKLLNGLIGGDDNRFRIRQLFALPDEYACNRFSFECQYAADTLSAVEQDPEAAMLKTIFDKGDIVVDYGVGKGRMLEELSTYNVVPAITYYAYDISDKDAFSCKRIMKACGVSEENYFNSIEDLKRKVEKSAKYVMLVGVLHEIEPKFWRDVFQGIHELLSDDGELIIVEREELTIGEAPYDNGFLMLTHTAASVLFGNNIIDFQRYVKNKYVVRYRIAKNGLIIIDEKIRKCVETIKQDSLQTIKNIKKTESPTDKERFNNGIRLAFHLQQYANAAIILETL